MNFLHDLYKKKKYRYFFSINLIFSLGDAVEGYDNKQFNEVKKKEASFIEARLENWYPYLKYFIFWEKYVP